MVTTIADPGVDMDWKRLAAAAHQESVRSSIDTVAAHLQLLFGRRLTAVIAGISDPKAVGQWARGGRKPHPAVERRLRDAFHVVRLLEPLEGPETIYSWFTGMNPELDDRAPALVIGEDPASVLGAAYAFVAHG